MSDFWTGGLYLLSVLAVSYVAVEAEGSVACGESCIIECVYDCKSYNQLYRV